MKHKKIISLLLSAVVVVGMLCGCGSDGLKQPKGIVSIDDPAVLQPNRRILSTELQKTKADSANSWSVDVSTLDENFELYTFPEI